MKPIITFFLKQIEPQYAFKSDEWILKYKVRILISISFIVGLLLAFFTLVRFIGGNYGLALADALFALHLLFSGRYLKRDKGSYDLISKLFLLIGFVVIFLNLHLAQETFTRVLWFASYIVLVFFLRDKEEGFIWMGIMIVLISLIAILEPHLRLDMINYLTFVINLLLTGVVLYWYDRLKQGDRERLKALNDSLQVRIDQAVEEKERQERMMIEQAKMAAMGEMIESIAHQWRQPLNILGLSIARIEMQHELGNPEPEKVGDIYEEMGRQIHYMSQTIDDFRSFYKKDKERMKVSLLSLVRGIEGLIGSLVEAKRIEIRNRVDASVMLTVYPNEFKQVLLNLITNAKDALIERRIETPWIEISGRNDADGTRVVISDNGGGIDKDLIPKIFEPYFTTKFASTGTGIGLYMSKTIVEEHMHGMLSVENSREGAVFTIFIPLEKMQELTEK